MSTSISSAIPNDLNLYSRIALTLDGEIAAGAGQLAGAISHFESTCREPGIQVRASYMPPVMSRFARDAEPTDRWVSTVANGFLAADSGGYPLPVVRPTPTPMKNYRWYASTGVGSPFVRPPGVSMPWPSPVPKQDNQGDISNSFNNGFPGQSTVPIPQPTPMPTPIGRRAPLPSSSDGGGIVLNPIHGFAPRPVPRPTPSPDFVSVGPPKVEVTPTTGWMLAGTNASLIGVNGLMYLDRQASGLFWQLRESPSGKRAAKPISAGTTTPPSDMSNLYSMIETMPNDIRIISIGPNEYTILLKGTEGMNLESLNLSGPGWLDNVIAMHHGSSDYAIAIMTAIDQAGIQDDAVIHFAGHSQGGMAAQFLADDPRFKRRYTVGSITSFGMPNLKPNAPDNWKAIVSTHDVIRVLDPFPGTGNTQYVLPTTWNSFTQHTDYENISALKEMDVQYRPRSDYAETGRHWDFDHDL